MKFRTWPYGTRKPILILDFLRQQTRSGEPVVVLTAHHLDDGDGSVLLIASDQFDKLEPPVKPDQVRMMEFREGGPTGGHWMIIGGAA